MFRGGWGDIEKGKQYAIVVDLDGKRSDATATGLKQDRVPGAAVFFLDRNFVHAIAERQGMTVYGQTGQTVMEIDLTGTVRALEYARKCQDEMGWGGWPLSTVLYRVPEADLPFCTSQIARNRQRRTVVR